MPKYQIETTVVFHALADPSRRLMVERLSRGPATVSELAAPLPMSLPSVVQHLGVLEASGLIRSQKVGRVRTCQLQPSALMLAEGWMVARRLEWERRFDRLGAYLAAQHDGDTATDDGDAASHDGDATSDDGDAAFEDSAATTGPAPDSDRDDRSSR